jgi:2-dehydro-3-deoxyphosphogalactonate aldolase
MILPFQDALSTCPLVAILRGVKPAEVVDIGQALIEAGLP